MKNKDRETLYLVLGLTGAGALVYAFFLIGSDTMRILALIVVIGLACSGVISALALPIRAWRKNDAAPVVRHFYHDGTRTVVRERVHDGRTVERVLDGRTVEAPRLFQLPSGPQQAAFPELLRAAWQAGQLSKDGSQGEGRHAYRELPAPDYDGSEGWEGEILG